MTQRSAGSISLDDESIGRGSVAQLTSPHPLGRSLPAIYQLKHPFQAEEDPPTVVPEPDPFVQRWTAGLDQVLAPVFSCLDNFDAYLDAQLAPSDFLDWLGMWMGLIADETWPIEQRRRFVSQARALYRIRGTPSGLAEHVRIFSGGEVQILEHGATGWSARAQASLPGSRGSDMVVRIVVEDPSQIDLARIDALIAVAKPAHLVHKVEVIAGSAPAAPQPSTLPADSRPQAAGNEQSTGGSEPPSVPSA